MLVLVEGLVQLLVRVIPVVVGFVEEQLGVERDDATLLDGGELLPSRVSRGLVLEGLLRCLVGVAHRQQEDEVGVGLDQGLQAVVGQQALVGVGDVACAQLGEHGAGLGRGRLDARAAGVRGQHRDAASALALGLLLDGGNVLGDVSAVFFVCLGVVGDIAAGLEHAQVVVEGGHVEVRHGDARRLQGVLEVGLCDAAAAAGVCTSQDDEVRVEGDDGLRVERREIADLFRLGFDVVIGKCIAGRADERAAGKLPDVRKAAHARYDALVGAHGYLVAQIVREGVAGLLACRALLRAVVAGAVTRASDHRAPACRQDQCTHACAGLCCDSLHAILLVLLVRLPIVAPLVFVD